MIKDLSDTELMNIIAKRYNQKILLDMSNLDVIHRIIFSSIESTNIPIELYSIINSGVYIHFSCNINHNEELSDIVKLLHLYQSYKITPNNLTVYLNLLDYIFKRKIL